jgi:hypothetical protein
MRISDADYTSENDFDSDLYEAPREKYIPGNSKPAKGRIISYQQTSEEPIKVDEEKSLDKAEEPNTNLSLDVSAGKALTIIAMFLFMFLLPVGLIEGAFNFDNLLRQEIYTSSVVAQNSNTNTNTNSANSGRVAGAADTQSNQSSSNQSQSLIERLRTREILGIPVNVILIVIGILLIVLPLLILIA